MKKVYFYLSKVLFVIGVILMGCFAVASVHDGYNYIAGAYKYHSAPLDLIILIHAVTYLLPGVISIVVAYVIKSKNNK